MRKRTYRAFPARSTNGSSGANPMISNRGYYLLGRCGVESSKLVGSFLIWAHPPRPFAQTLSGLQAPGWSGTLPGEACVVLKYARLPGMTILKATLLSPIF